MVLSSDQSEAEIMSRKHGCSILQAEEERDHPAVIQKHLELHETSNSFKIKAVFSLHVCHHMCECLWTSAFSEDINRFSSNFNRAAIFKKLQFVPFLLNMDFK